jgi:putative tricarboxylic transport membrane protein
MTTTPSTPASTGAGATRGAGRSGLVLAVLMLALAVYLTVGIITMNVPVGAESPGPTFYPTVLAVACYLLAASLVVHYVRSPEAPEEADGVEAVDDTAHATFTDWRTLGMTMAGFLAFALLLNPLGWIIAAALMFWVIAFAMGSKSRLTDVAVALVMSCAIQVAFSAGLGLHLPAGILEGVL